MLKQQLMPNCHASSWGVEKFSGVISNKVAAPNSPTTAGRSPLNMLSIRGWCIYRINSLLMSIISISDGSTSAKVAVTEPRMAIGME